MVRYHRGTAGRKGLRTLPFCRTPGRRQTIDVEGAMPEIRSEVPLLVAFADLERR